MKRYWTPETLLHHRVLDLTTRRGGSSRTYEVRGGITDKANRLLGHF